MGHDWDCPKNQILPGSSMYKDQEFLTFAINIFHMMKFISKCEILKKPKKFYNLRKTKV